jgi:hypothetical protein
LPLSQLFLQTSCSNPTKNLHIHNLRLSTSPFPSSKDCLATYSSSSSYQTQVQAFVPRTQIDRTSRKAIHKTNHLQVHKLHMEGQKHTRTHTHTHTCATFSFWPYPEEFMVTDSSGPVQDTAFSLVLPPWDAQSWTHVWHNKKQEVWGDSVNGGDQRDGENEIIPDVGRLLTVIERWNIRHGAYWWTQKIL